MLGVRVERRGTLRALDDYPDSHDLFLRVFLRTLDVLGGPSPAGTLVLDSEIPIGKGFGSSAAAVVGAIGLAAASAGDQASPALVLRVAQEYENHLDNVAPSLLGGLVAVARDEQDHPHAFSIPMSDHVAFAFAAPGAELETKRARAALPGHVALTDAVYNLGALVALARGLATGDPALLAIGFGDRLHVRHRLALIPGAEEAIVAARAAGAWGATISGAGSGLVAIGERSRSTEVADAMGEAFRRAAGPHGVIAFPVEAATQGLTHG